MLLANDGRIVVTGFGTTPGDDPGPAAELRALGALLDATASALPSAPPSKDDRAGALHTLVEGLLHEDPEHSPDTERVERELRRLTTGGAGPARSEARPGAPSVPADAPTDARTDMRTNAPVGGEPGRRSGSTGGNTPAEDMSSLRRSRGTRAPRRAHVLLAGLIGALLIAGALAYHLARDDERGAGPGPGGVTSTAPAGPGATDGAGGGPVRPRS